MTLHPGSGEQTGPRLPVSTHCRWRTGVGVSQTLPLLLLRSSLAWAELRVTYRLWLWFIVQSLTGFSEKNYVFASIERGILPPTIALCKRPGIVCVCVFLCWWGKWVGWGHKGYTLIFSSLYLCIYLYDISNILKFSRQWLIHVHQKMCYKIQILR